MSLTFNEIELIVIKNALVDAARQWRKMATEGELRAPAASRVMRRDAAEADDIAKAILTAWGLRAAEQAEDPWEDP